MPERVRDKATRLIARFTSFFLVAALFFPASALTLSWRTIPVSAARQAAAAQPAAPAPTGPTCTTATLSAGGNQFLAVDAADGSVWAWGGNNNGELGNGTTVSSGTPTRVVGVGGAGTISGMATVAAGLTFSFAATNSDGTVLAWGRGNEGELGNGASTSSTTPVHVSGLTNVIGLAAGFEHGLAVDTSGHVWAWGGNTWGQLGNNSSTSAPTPVEVLAPDGIHFLDSVVAVAAGEFQSLALKADGTVWAWGFGGDGELGNGSFANSSLPVQVSGLSGALAIGAGSAHSLAVGSDNTVWAWGNNSSGQLGDGTSISSAVPVHVVGPGGSGLLSGIFAVHGGDGYSVAASSGGAAYAWGANDSGQLGIGTTDFNNHPTPTQIFGVGGSGTLGNVTGITASFGHSGTVESDGSVTTWGSSTGPPNGSSQSPQTVIGLGKIAQPSACQLSGPPAAGPTPPSQTGGGSPSTPPASSCQNIGHPVNCATGEFWHRFLDLAVKARGPGLFFARTYSSMLANQDGPLGFGWTHGYNMGLSFNTDASVSIREEGGSVITFTPSGTGGYSAPGWVFATFMRNADGTYTLGRKNQVSYIFNASGQLTREQDRNGYATTLSYGGGQLSAVTDSSGRQLQFQYSGTHLVKVTDPIQRAVSFQYDSAGSLVAATDVGGGVTRMTYDTNHLLLTMTDPNGGVVKNQYDASGRVSSQTDAMSRTTNWSYTTGITTITDPKGNAIQETYKQGRLVSLTKAFGTSQAATWSMTYDQTSFGLTSITDPNGHTTKYTLDALANVLSVMDPLGRISSFTYDGLNDQTSLTDPMGNTTQLSYDAHGNLTTATRPINGSVKATTTLSYDPTQAGDVTVVTDPAGNIWKLSYDQFGDANRTADPLGSVTTFSFDQISRLMAVVSPRGNAPGGHPAAFTTSYTYDSFGDTLTTTDPLGHKTSYQYDAVQNLIAVTDANGHTTNYAFDLDNEPLSGKAADGSQVGYIYDANANIASHIDPLGHATTYAYDAFNRVTSSTDPLGRTTRYAYDAAGNPTTATDALGRTTSFAVDAANELTTITYSDGRTPKVTLTYDRDGRRVGMSDGTGASSYSYDAASQLTQSINGAGAKVGYGYDLNGNPTSLTYPDGSAVTRTFDATGRLATLTDWAGRQTKFSYDANGNLTNQAYPNGVMARYAYNAADQLSQITDSGPQGQIAFTESRDNTGQLTAENVTGEPPGGPISYTYDAGSRLTAANYGGPKLSYQYDAADRLTQITNTLGRRPVVSTLTYDNADQLLNLTSSQDGTVTKKLQFSYDANGNRTQVTNQAGASTSYTYDQANRLTAYGTNAQYQYNGDGLRMAKSVGGVAEAFTWDLGGGQLPTVIQDGTTRYVMGPGGLPLEQVSADGTIRYYHQDALGSTRALTDAAGHLDSVYLYDPYGNLLAFFGSHSPNPFQFAGQYTDPESGFQYLRARYYDPSTAQFISSDPLSPATSHRYAYASDNPINNVDPTGLFDLLKDVGPYAGMISTFLGGLALITLADPPIAGALEIASTAFGVLGAVYDCKKNWFSVDCGFSVAGALLGGVGLIAKVGRLLWTLPVILARRNLQALAFAVMDLAGGGQKLIAFAQQALRLQHLADSFGFRALSAAIAGIGQLIQDIELATQPAARQTPSSGTMQPATMPAC